MASGHTRRRGTDRQILTILCRRYCRRLKLRLLRFFRNVPDIKDRVRWLRAYLNRIVRCLRREVMKFSRHPADLSRERIEANLDSGLVAMIGALPYRHGRVFRLLLQGYSHREIAVRAGILPGAVGPHLMRARQDLAQMMIPRGGSR
jgi:DNA-directed RNA polymerase specialized sigma24 family protein